ncbi:MAG TPA: M20/M25/M40 family metallo-hydrolase [Candidatus Limnocylindria bacterium]|nr:M20/M25/M40 family metallo-hydrolase [Candidatus Limnocylindria bacterium]
MSTWTTFDRILAARRRTIVETFVDFLRLESVSQQPQKVRVAGEWLAAAMRARGLAGRVLETGGNPAVFGERRVPGATRTVLIYCHYDTKPIPLSGWLQPNPIEPVFRRGLAEEGARAIPWADIADGDLDDFRVYARGASDDKGPIWCHLNAFDVMDAAGILPRVNVKLIFDGEEEIGSPFFGAFTERHRDLLAADLVIVTDGPKHASGRPTISGGARGVMKIELEIEAARRDLHSGNFAAPNPAWKLNGLLASIATPDGAPLIEGFEEDVVGPTAGEREMMAALPLDLPALEKELGVRLPADYLDRVMFHPTLTIRGLHSGFVGKEANTIIPHKATVSIDIRMVKNQRWSKVYRRIIDHIRAQGLTVLESADEPLPDELRGRAVRVVDKGGYDPAKTSLELPVSREVIAAVERAHNAQPAVLMPTLGGSVPLFAFTDILNLPTLVVPYANANNRQHSPNEHLRLDHLFQGVRTTAQLLTDLGGS